MTSAFAAAEGIGIPAIWRAPALRLAAVWFTLFAVFRDDWSAMARQWWNISTYNHIILIPPILAWLVWQRWSELQKIEPRVWWPGLILFAGTVFLWMIGAISGLDLARQAGAAAMLGAMVPLLLGPRVATGLLFPLSYLAFLVPFGEELVKVLQTVTADITVALTRASGIPAAVDGVFIDTPAGLFEVAEACSGIKFLIAMAAFGMLAANVCFISWPRRMAMLAACLIVPVLANGIRAWGTIYAAQLFGVEAASGFDHIVYGWFFFAIVLALVIAGAWRFFDRPWNDPVIDAAAIMRKPWLTRLAGMRIAPWAGMLGLAVLLAAAAGWTAAADRLSAPLPRQIDLPQVPGWTRADYAPQIWWEPKASGAEHRLLGSYADGRGRKIDVFLAVYSGQGEGREAGGFGQGALMPDSGWAWQSAGQSFGNGKSERLLGGGKVERLAVTWYRNGGLLSGSNAQLKLAVIGDHLSFRAEPTAMLIISAEDAAGEPAADAIAHFLSSLGPLDSWIDRIVQVR
ncbi:MAG TPA: exosortase A [Novosphingobium sp.]|nr:exosortase A [Novosphingobium sp.]